MKNKISRILAILMSTVMIISMVGCGEKTTPTDAPKATDASKATEAPKATDAATEAPTEAAPSWTNDYSEEITIFLNGGDSPSEDSLVVKALEEATGVNIKIISCESTDYSTKLSTMLAGGQVPDIFSSNVADVRELKERGMIADMSDVLNALAPNVMNEVGDILTKIESNSDGIYLVPNALKSTNTAICIRTDWLENLGLDMPTDLESFADVLHAFTYDDPDKNGEKDTFGYVLYMDSFCSPNRTLSNVFGAYGIAKGRPMEIDGVVTSWVNHPNFLEAMKYIKGLIDDGVCEPDYLTAPFMSAVEKLWNGTAGVMEWEPEGPINNWMPGRYTEDPVPTFDYAFLEGPYGDMGTAENYKSMTTGYVFSSACKNLEGAAKVANFLMTEEGSDLMYLGVEGVMYNWIDKEAGTYERLGKYTEDAVHREEGAYKYWGLFAPANNAQIRTLKKQCQEGIELVNKVGIEWANITAVSEVYEEYGSEMDQIIKEMCVELLAADEDDMQGIFDSYMKEWRTVGGTEWEKEVTELWNAQAK